MDDGKEGAGQKWLCRICTIHRRLTGGLVEAESTLDGQYVVTRFPDGVTYCTCAAWKFQRVPPKERACKHTERITA